jgi:hypothetical protein
MTMTAFDATRKRQRLQADLEAMLATELPVIPEEEPDLMDESVEAEGYRRELPGQEPFDPTSQELPEGFDHGFPGTYPENYTDVDHAFPENHPDNSSDSGDDRNQESVQAKKKRITPDQATFILYDKWKALLPLLLDDILAYTTTSVGVAIQTVGSELRGLCRSPSTCSKSLDLKATKVTCLYFDRKLD